jgi:hypothetical protein
MKPKINIAEIKLSAKKIVDDKKLVRDYLNGKITLKALDDKGIKLAMPI